MFKIAFLELKAFKRETLSDKFALQFCGLFLFVSFLIAYVTTVFFDKYIVEHYRYLADFLLLPSLFGLAGGSNFFKGFLQSDQKNIYF